MPQVSFLSELSFSYRVCRMIWKWLLIVSPNLSYLQFVDCTTKRLSWKKFTIPTLYPLCLHSHISANLLALCVSFSLSIEITFVYRFVWCEEVKYQFSFVWNGVFLGVLIQAPNGFVAGVIFKAEWFFFLLIY